LNSRVFWTWEIFSWQVFKTASVVVADSSIVEDRQFQLIRLPFHNQH
jgi:hypothetical protein